MRNTLAYLVGYQTSDFTDKIGSMAITGVMFQNTTGAELSIQDIKLSEEMPPDGSTYMMYWDGYWVQPYWVELQDVEGNPAGWGDQNNWETVNKVFFLGEAFFLSPSDASETAGVTVSGQVYSCPEQYGAILLTKGSMDFVSPVFPTSTYSIQNFKLCDNVPPDGSSYIMYWEGYWIQPYWVELQDVDGNPAGWGDQNNWETVTKTFKAGEGFFACASDACGELDAEILFPNPLAKKE